MSMAEGVIVAKARSMHGEALSEEMYQELLHKKSVAEIAGYLKHETSYAAALKDVRENNIHRGQLESILRQEIFKKTMKLYRYADAAMKPYYRLHMQQMWNQCRPSWRRRLQSGPFRGSNPLSSYIQ